jgi:hypothetical protein
MRGTSIRLQEFQNGYKILIGKGEENRLVRTGCKRESTTKQLTKQGVRVWTGLNWLRIWYNGGICEHSNEYSGYTKKTGNAFTTGTTIKFPRMLLKMVRQLMKISSHHPAV